MIECRFNLVEDGKALLQSLKNKEKLRNICRDQSINLLLPALERFFAGVRPHVRDKVTLHRHRFAANVAHVRFLFRVGSHVIF